MDRTTKFPVGAPERIKFVFQNYAKPPDPMILTVKFGGLPDGTNHVTNGNMNGVSKQ